MPETLLKKRKQNEKAREDRIAAATAARKVSCSMIFEDYDAYDFLRRTARRKPVLPSINHLSGLNLFLFSFTAFFPSATFSISRINAD